MNFLLCNKCNKKSEDNILNFNTTEILVSNNKSGFINSNIMNQIETIEQFQNLNIGDNITTSVNNLNNLDDKSEEELEIIEYPFSKKEKSFTSSKLSQSKIVKNHNLLERDILNQLYHFEINKESEIGKTGDKNFFRNHISKKLTNINLSEDEIERKDTMTDPANLALYSLIQDLNKKNINKDTKNNNNNNKIYKEEVSSINDNYFFPKNNNLKKQSKILKNNHKNNNNISNHNNNINNNIKSHRNNINNHNNSHFKLKEKNIKNKLNKDNFNNNKKSDIIINKNNKTKSSIKNGKINEYNNIINKKKDMLKNKKIVNNKTNLLMNSLNLSNGKQFPKSYSFNCFNSEKKRFNGNKFEYSCALKKKYNLLYNNIFRNNFIKSSPKQKDKNKLKLSNKKVGRGQMHKQKFYSSHIDSYFS